MPHETEESYTGQADRHVADLGGVSGRVAWVPLRNKLGGAEGNVWETMEMELCEEHAAFEILTERSDRMRFFR